MYSLSECGIYSPNTNMRRFHPFMWHVNFGPSAMATIVSYPGILYGPPFPPIGDRFVYEQRVNYRLTANDDFVGVFWDSEDFLSHKAMRYETNTDYSGLFLSLPIWYDGTGDLSTFDEWALTITYTNESVYYVKMRPYMDFYPNYDDLFSFVMDFDDMWAGDNREQKIPASGIKSIMIGLTPANAGFGAGHALASFGNSSAGRCNNMVVSNCNPELIMRVGDIVRVKGQLDTIAGVTPRTPGTVEFSFDASPGSPDGIYLQPGDVGSKLILEPVQSSPIPVENHQFYFMFDISDTDPVDSSHPYGLKRWVPNPSDTEPEPIALQMTGGFDDMYNMNPYRLIEDLWRLGYGGIYNLYVGMSHYQQLIGKVDGSGNFYNVIDTTDARKVNVPTQEWIKRFVSGLNGRGFDTLILSLSLELLGMYTVHDGEESDEWVQRDADGAPALSGWSPPSSFVSPASVNGIEYLSIVLRDFIEYGQYSGTNTIAQVGEPWWWTNTYSDFNLCIYDENAKQRYFDETGEEPLLPYLRDIRAVTDPDIVYHQAYLDWLRNRLGDGVHEIMALTKTTYPGINTTLLLFSPTIIAPEYPIQPVLNLPLDKYEFPNFDFLQLEDYDWVIEGRWDDVESTFDLYATLLYTDLSQQHYFTGFILLEENRWQWWRLDHAADLANARGVGNVLVWAQTQVARDGLFWYGFGDPEAVSGFSCGGGACGL